MFFIEPNFLSLAWTPAAPRRARVHQHQRDYGSANSIDHFNPEFNAESNLLVKNQSQPYLLTYQETKEKKENEPGTFGLGLTSTNSPYNKTIVIFLIRRLKSTNE